jgi:flagellar protein FlbD
MTFAMIELTKLNGSKLVINSDLIEFVEALPDSLITLTTGKKIMVQEKIPEIISAVVSFRRLISLPPDDLTERRSHPVVSDEL